MKIICFSDMHYGRDINTPHVQPNKGINIFGTQSKEILFKILKKEKDIDMIVFLGDNIASTDTETDTKRLKEIVEVVKKTKKPYSFIRGNHDEKYLDVQKFSEITRLPILPFSINKGGITQLFLDQVIYKGKPHLNKVQINWLRKKINQTRNQIIVYGYLHYFNSKKEKGISFITSPSLVERNKDGKPSKSYTILHLSNKVLKEQTKTI